MRRPGLGVEVVKCDDYGERWKKVSSPGCDRPTWRSST
jgi:hypothetical protein